MNCRRVATTMQDMGAALLKAVWEQWRIKTPFVCYECRAYSRYDKGTPEQVHTDGVNFWLGKRLISYEDLCERFPTTTDWRCSDKEGFSRVGTALSERSKTLTYCQETLQLPKDIVGVIGEYHIGDLPITTSVYCGGN